MAWKSPNEFSISGTDVQGHLQRVLLRFSSEQAAKSLADAISLLPKPVVVAGVPTVEEVQVYVRFYYPRPIVLASAAGIALWIGLLAWAAVSYGFIGLLIILYFPGLFILRLLPVPIAAHFSGPTPGRLRAEEKTIQLTAKGDITYPRFTLIEWEGPRQFVFKIGLKRVEIGFADENEAQKAVLLIKTRFPAVREAHALSSRPL